MKQLPSKTLREGLREEETAHNPQPSWHTYIYVTMLHQPLLLRIPILEVISNE